jgi:branched-chain amino acid transport system ATP-binding protein
MLEIRQLDVHRGPSHVLKSLDMDVPAGRITSLIGANGAGKTTTLMTISGLLRPTRGRITLSRDDGTRQELTGLRPDAIVALGVAHCPEGRQIFPSLTVRENLIAGAYSRRDPAGVGADLDRMATLFPGLLLLDEPSLGLAPNLVERIFRTLEDIIAGGITIVLVEQNAGAALRLADHAYVLETGRISRRGSGAELLRDPAVKDAYLGLAG